MRIISFTHNASASWGIQTDHGVIDLGRRTPWPSFRDAIPHIHRLQDHAHHAPDLALTDVTPEIPLPNPEKILCVGVNFPDRNAEYKDGQDAPSNMSLFPRFPRSFTGHGQPLIRRHDGRRSAAAGCADRIPGCRGGDQRDCHD